MACNIINSKDIKVNGGSTLYGGAITNLSFNFGGLSNGHSASVSVIKTEIGSLGTPKSQDEVTIELLGLNLKMHVSAYRLNTSASGATTLNISLRDQSNKFLDHDFIVLAEEFPKKNNADNIHIIGDKYGTLPHKETAELTGSIVPNSDTEWGSIRKFVKDLKSPASLFGGGDNLFDEGGIDNFVKSTSGKSSYYTNKDTDGDSSAKTLKDVLGSLITGDFPNLSFDFTGSFREVIVSICNSLGYFAYWDMSESKVKIVKKFTASAGKSVLAGIAKSCNAISASSSEDFTVTSSQSALGTFSSSDPGETTKMYGAGVTRYFDAHLLSPEFHYSTCSKPKELKVLDFEDVDVQKAITAAYDDEVFAMYALQTMLKVNEGKAEFDFEADAFVLPGKDNEIDKIVLKAKKQLSGDTAPYTENKFISDFFKGSSKDELCGASVYAVLPIEDSVLDRQLENKKGEWNGNVTSPPYLFAGEYSEGFFDHGRMFIHEAQKFNTILDENSELSAQNNILMHYLKAIADFKDRFYVVREQLNLRTIRGNIGGHNYKYYMTSSTAGGSANFKINGYRHIQINPFLSVNESDTFRALAKTVHAMYNRSGNVDEVLSAMTIVDLIRALDRNELKKMFMNPAGYAKSSVVNQNKLSENAHDVPAVNMHIMEKVKASSEGLFAKITATVFDAGEFYDINVDNPAVSIAKEIGKISVNKGEGVLANFVQENKKGKWNLSFIGNKDISTVIKPSSIGGFPVKKIKMEYNVEGLESTIKKSAGHFSISASEIKLNKKLWRGNLVQNISINASDIGATNDVFSKFKSTAADDSYVYSKKNQDKMELSLAQKVKNNAWEDGVSAVSDSLKFVLAGNVKIPTIEQGLQTLNVQSSDGNITIDVSVGNENAKKAQMAMNQMKSQGSKIRHGYGSIIPDGNQDFSPKFISLVKGMIT